MPKVEQLANDAQMIIQGYAFIPRNDGITVINLHNLEHAAFIFNDEIIETTMDEIEAYKVQKLYDSNKQYLEAEYA